VVLMGVRGGIAVLLAAAALALAGCGGTGDAVAEQADELQQETTTTATAPEDETTTSEPEPGGADAPSGSVPDAPAPATGQAVVALDDGRVLEAEVRSCTINPNGTFQVNGGDAPFTMAQLILGDQWQQSQVELEFANGNSLYVIVSGASEGAEQAAVEGKRITWTADTFRELDPAANRHVYEGQGTVQVACP
jgi:hypothetical protein